MNGPLRPDAIEAEASLWLARRRDGVPQPAEEDAFALWLAADPRHRDAYGRMERTLADISALGALAELEPLDPAARRLRSGSGPSRLRRAAPALGAAAAALIAAVVVLPGLLAGQRLEASTAVGEVRDLTLRDGTRVSLAPGSRIRARMVSGAREVELTQGEAFFEVVHDPARPFTVRAGDTVIRDIGTRFDIVRNGSAVRISVVEGSVEVSRRSEPGRAARTLVRGQGAEIAQAAPGPGTAAPAPAPILVQASAPTAGAWRTGRLDYEDVRLGDIVADLNRYYRPGVRLGDPALAGRRVAASFKVEEIETFLADLPKALPVTVSHDAQGATVIAPAGPSRSS